MIFRLGTAGRDMVVSAGASYLTVLCCYSVRLVVRFLRSSRQNCWNIIQHINHNHSGRHASQLIIL